MWGLETKIRLELETVDRKRPWVEKYERYSVFFIPESHALLHMQSLRMEEHIRKSGRYMLLYPSSSGGEYHKYILRNKFNI